MKPFTEEARYEYDLKPESVCLDCGGYEGRWAKGISDRYHCTVHVLEPIRKSHANIVKIFEGVPNVAVYRTGIGRESGMVPFHIKGDMTGQWADNPETEWVPIMSVQDVFNRIGLYLIDVMKLNIEGGEFDVIESLIETDLIQQVRNLQVQWHDVAPGSVARFESLQRELAASHHLTFDAQWIWQNWEKNV